MPDPPPAALEFVAYCNVETEDLEWKYLEGDGDFRSEEVKRLRDEADIIVTNPPFSLFREFLAWILEGDSNRVYRVDGRESDFGRGGAECAKNVLDRINKIDRIGDDENPDNPVNPVKKNLPVSTRSTRLNETAKKKFLIIGNMNAITYKEVFPLIKDNRLWLGATGFVSDMVFAVPKGTTVPLAYKEKAAKMGYIGDYTRLGNSCWFTNLEHGRRHQPLQLMTMADNIKFSRHKDLRGKEYQKYDNYDAIEVPFTDAIPSDYGGVILTDLTVADICDGFVYDVFRGFWMFEFSNLKRLRRFTLSRRKKPKRWAFRIAHYARSATRRAQSESGSLTKWTQIT